MRIGPRRLGALTLLVLVFGAVPAAAAPDPAVIDCTVHNALTKTYTVQQLQHALGTMSADIKEYTACSDVIQRQLDRQLGGLHANGGGSGGGAFLPVPLLVLLVLLLLGGAGYGAVLLRRRADAEAGVEGEPGSATDGEDDPPAPAPPG